MSFGRIWAGHNKSCPTMWLFLLREHNSKLCVTRNSDHWSKEFSPLYRLPICTLCNTHIHWSPPIKTSPCNLETKCPNLSHLPSTISIQHHPEPALRPTLSFPFTSLLILPENVCGWGWHLLEMALVDSDTTCWHKRITWHRPWMVSSYNWHLWTWCFRFFTGISNSVLDLKH